MTITRDDPRFWDVRTLQRRLRRGQVSKKDYEKFLKSLPDVADKVAPTADFVDDDDDDDDDDVESDLDVGSNGVHQE
jgi:hypothetical protein